LRRSKKWTQVSAVLYGGNKTQCYESLKKTGGRSRSGYGGHFRAVQGFKYLGTREERKSEMKIFFYGQRSFGAAVLKRLIADGHTITGTAVPEPGQYYDNVHILAIKEKLPVLPVDKIMASDIPEGTELIVAAHSHHFISEKALRRTAA
jgi:hypothetical protein